MTVEQPLSLDKRRRRLPRRLPALFFGLVAAAACARAAPAEIEVRDAAVRAPRPGFHATVVSMTVGSARAARIVGASSGVAGAIELHRVVREGSEVRMVQVPGIALAAGEPVRLQLGEGRFHLMATHLKRPLAGGEQVAIRLLVEDDRTGARRTVAVRVPVVGNASRAGEGEDHLH